MSGNRVSLLTIAEHFSIHFKGSNGSVSSVNRVTNNSRNADSGTLFVAMRGTVRDGHSYVLDALSRGCRVFVVEREDITFPDGVLYARVDDSREIYNDLVNCVWGRPSERLHVVGITGTNGKSTTAFLVRHVLAPRYEAGIITTLYGEINDVRYPLENTTPDFSVVTELMDQMVKAGHSHCAMEVSSHALDQGRIRGCHFGTLVFTNLTQDHLDYHHTMEEYYAAKRTLFFEHNEGALVIINSDDIYGRKLCAEYGSNSVTFGLEESATVFAHSISLRLDGSSFNVTIGEETVHIETQLFGFHNVYNTLAAIAVSWSQGVPLSVVAERMAVFSGVCGRMEYVANPLRLPVFVDYAHTPDAIHNVLHSLAAVTKKPLVVVFGCGGDRDRTKRVPMRKAVLAFAARVVITNDNPRTEDPHQIFADIQEGMSPADGSISEIVPDRARAIQQACRIANECSGVVVILGKGHEDYQIIGSEKHHFSDQETVVQSVERMQGTKRTRVC